jgi:hypothetical protein
VVKAVPTRSPGVASSLTLKISMTTSLDSQPCEKILAMPSTVTTPLSAGTSFAG